jgi:hypothetical protein
VLPEPHRGDIEPPNSVPRNASGDSFSGASMRDDLSKAEHYRKLAAKNHELAKFAQPGYLGDFYRNVAVRYAFMAQEASKLAEKELGPTAERSGSPAVQDFDLLTLWAGDRLRSGGSK